MNYQDAVKELWKLMNTIPAKLFKNNIVSEERYFSLIKKCNEMWKRMQ
jgi:hypothetical protein